MFLVFPIRPARAFYLPIYITIQFNPSSPPLAIERHLQDTHQSGLQRSALYLNPGPLVTNKWCVRYRNLNSNRGPIALLAHWNAI